MLKHETAGDPITGLKWTRRTTYKIAAELQTLGIQVSPNTVGKLLKAMGYCLRVNHKKLPTGRDPDRDRQFAYIGKLRARHERDGLPIISVDTKKRELIGNFKNPGASWEREPVLVNDHDFPSIASGVAIPYGVYDVPANQGAVFIGVSYDTSEFAVDCLTRWWCWLGKRRYPDATELLVLADAGGSNNPTRRLWKYCLQTKLCDRHGISVTVCHYPTGASKYNPIDHRLFSEISKNWAGKPLTCYQTILNYIRTTQTATGLSVRADLLPRTYVRGLTPTDRQMQDLSIQPHPTVPKWNYTILPR